LETLDDIDRRVVAALQADGRRPFSSIADELSIAESVVRYRAQRMERAGILQVVGIADPLKLGFDLMALVGIKVTPGMLGDVCAAAATLPETSYVAGVAGRYDVFVELVCRDSAHFQQVLVGSLQTIAGVASTESFLILEIHKMAYGWGAGKAGVPVAEPAPERPAAKRRPPAVKRARTARAGGSRR
jgi:Lrp/AsnC family transcriptional regulator for asnA, asnC and gidA